MGKKKTTIKKPVIKLDTSTMTAEERVTFARATQNTAKASTVYQGSPSAQASMATWQKASDALDANNQGITKAAAALTTLHAQETGLVFDYDIAASDYASQVRLLAKDDLTIVTAMGLTEKADRTVVAAIAAPLAVHVATSRLGLDAVTWDAVPGAHLYMVQYSVDPATDTSWITIEGGGRRRKLGGLGLVHGQKYVLRVRALGANQEGPWSATLSYVGK